MEREQLIAHAKRLLKKVGDRKGAAQQADYMSQDIFVDGMEAEVREFFRSYAGPKSSFFAQVSSGGGYTTLRLGRLHDVLRSFIEYAEAGLVADVSPERQAQLDVVSDFLDQAQSLLKDKKVHPAAPAVLIGASLEEFLRTWVEDAGVAMKNRKPSLQNYAQSLRDEEKITKQDMKDITSWSGIRNSAAHGQWDEVSDRKRVFIMLESINLFMRSYSSS